MNKELRKRVIISSIVLLAILFSLGCIKEILPQEDAHIAKPQYSKMDSTLQKEVKEAISSGELDREIPIVIRFYSELNEKEITDLEKLNVEFYKSEGKIIVLRRIYLANASIDSIIRLSNYPKVEVVEYGLKETIPLQ